MLVSLGHSRILQAQLGRKHPRIAFALCITLAASFSGSSSYLNITHTSRLPLGWHLPSSAFCVAPPQLLSQFARGSLVLLFNWVFFFCVCFSFSFACALVCFLVNYCDFYCFWFGVMLACNLPMSSFTYAKGDAEGRVHWHSLRYARNQFCTRS